MRMFENVTLAIKHIQVYRMHFDNCQKITNKFIFLTKYQQDDMNLLSDILSV